MRKYFLIGLAIATSGCAPSVTSGFNQGVYDQEIAQQTSRCSVPQGGGGMQNYVTCMSTARLSAARAAGAPPVMLSGLAANSRDQIELAAKVDSGELTFEEAKNQNDLLTQEYLIKFAQADAVLKEQYRHRLNETVTTLQNNQLRQAQINALNRAARPSLLPATTNCSNLGYGQVRCTTW